MIGYGESGGADYKFLVKKGFKLKFIPMQRGGVNLFNELKTFFKVWKFFKEENPDIVHLITIKPYLYGGIVSRMTGVKSLVTTVSGLGSLFIGKNLKNYTIRSLLYPLYKIAFNHFNQKVILQNEDDLKLLVEWGILNPSKSKLIRGSGVDLGRFKKLEEPKGNIIVCFAARLIRDKGVYDFVSATQILKQRGIDAIFYLAGNLDRNNPTGLSLEDVDELKRYNNLKFLGFQKDVPTLFSKCHIICLPSYREGFPKSLMEAAAAGRAIVTTDVPGCRDAIIPNKTGLIVPIKSPEKLADALQKLIENPKDRIAMGKAGRKLAEKEFLIEKIVYKHLKIYQELTDKI